MPHEIMILDCQVLGEKRFKTRFEGASKMMYGTCELQSAFGDR
jgi:hypothetical protein